MQTSGINMTEIFGLVGFEESQAITIQLRKMGIIAFSCDLQLSSGGFPQWHLQMDIFEALQFKKWDLIILHPPCTYTALSGNRWYWNSKKRIEGIELCKNVWIEACNICNYVALEQPKSIMQKYIGQRTQTIHPWQFGHGETKETWLWLKGFPKLQPTKIVKGRSNKIWKMSPSKDRSKLRSKTYTGIAKAIAQQWLLNFKMQNIDMQKKYTPVDRYKILTIRLDKSNNEPDEIQALCAYYKETGLSKSARTPSGMLKHLAHMKFVELKLQIK